MSSSNNRDNYPRVIERGDEGQTRPPAPPSDLPSHEDFDNFQSVDEMAAPINRIGRRNKALLSSIDALLKRKPDVNLILDYAVLNGVGKCVLVEGRVKRSNAVTLTSFKPTGSMTPLSDSLGLRIDFNFATGDDVLRLCKMLRLVHSEVMDNCSDEDDAEGVKQARIYAQNLLVLHENLVSLCEELKDTDAEVLRARDAELAEINARILRFHEAYGVHFKEPPEPEPAPNTLFRDLFDGDY